MPLSRLAAAVAATLAAAGAAAYAFARDDAPAERPATPAAAAGDCPVTRPNGVAPRGHPRTPTSHGTGGLGLDVGETSTIYAAVGREQPPPGTLLGQLRPDGSVYAKILWRRDRRAWGALRIDGERVGTEPAQRLRAQADDEYPRRDVVPSSLRFPQPGCWRVRARAGEARLTIVLRVVSGAADASGR